MGVEKALVKLNGKPLIEYALEIMEKLSGNILISSNSHSFDAYPAKIVSDLFPDSGPMGGIYSCLKNSGTQINLVLSCDTPFVKPELFLHLLKCVDEYSCVVPWHGNEHYEPLCAVYRKDTELLFREFIRKANFRIPDLLHKTNSHFVRMDEALAFHSDSLFLNINSKKELEQAEKMIIKLSKNKA